MKRWIAALLSAVLLLSVSGAALAADPDTVEISSAEDLAELSALCTSDAWSEGKTIVLTRDISLTGCDFSPIPLLSGTFDGRGHSILGISLDGDASTQGLFRMVLKNGVVENLTVSGTLHATGNGENIGGIAGVNYGAIENCRFDGDILAQAAAGGIVGLNQEGALVSECKTSGSISAYHRAGGIAGENRGVLSECENRMSVNTDYIAAEKPDQKKSFDISTLTLNEETIIDITDLGGIAGLNTSVIKYCDNYGDVGYPHTGYNVGGIAGRQSGRVLGCTNAGEVTARKDVGGIVGQVEPYTSWNVTGTGLGEVQSQLYRLESLLRTTLGDFGLNTKPTATKFFTQKSTVSASSTSPPSCALSVTAPMRRSLSCSETAAISSAECIPTFHGRHPAATAAAIPEMPAGGATTETPAAAMTPPADGSIRAAAQWTISPIIFSRSYVFSAR